MPVYFARPANATIHRSCLVAMEIFGLHEYIKDVTRRVAKLGALAVAPDYYFRKGTDLTKITEIKELLPIVNAKPDAELLAISTPPWPGRRRKAATPAELGIIGFCRGGRTVWEYAAHSGALKAGVAFYGPVVDPQNPLWPKSPTQLAPEMKAPVLGLYGSADTGIPVAQVEAMKAALAEQQEDRRVQDLSRCPARLPCRLSRELPQGRSGGCLEPDAKLVQEIRRAQLAPGLSEPIATANSRRDLNRGDRRYAAIWRPVRSPKEPRQGRRPSQ